MVSFLIYDLILLVSFVVFFSYFLHSRKKNIKREGLLILYRTTWGMKLIDRIGKKFPRTLYVLSYVSITVGYALMGLMIYLLGKIVYIYATQAALVKAIKVPPIFPIVPYIDKVVPDLGLPSFYFAYFIIVLAIIAITHEMSHGIFMRRYNIKIKSTGFGFFPWFLPILPAAFVEQDESSMKKSKKFEQLAVLSAGTFANVLTAILFFVVLWVFFLLTFSQSGVTFDTYPYVIAEASAVTMINGIALDNPTYSKLLELSNDAELNKVEVDDLNFVTKKSFLEKQGDNDNILLYYDSPAINIKLESIILEINGVKINDIDVLRNEILKYSPGEKIIVTVLRDSGENLDREIILGTSPEDGNKAWLGIGFRSQEKSGILGKLYSNLNFKEPNVYYEPKFNAVPFIYDLLWWIILISVSVALVNMLPVGIFDGGMFFYLTVLAITGKEEWAKKAFSFSTFFIIGIFSLLMLIWAYRIFL